MTEPKDLVIQSTWNVPTVSTMSQKPSYLVKFLSEGKKAPKLFFAVEQPKFELSYVQVKGFFYTGAEESVYSQYNEIVTGADRSTFVEMWLPWHVLDSVRSLVFKGDKTKK